MTDSRREVTRSTGKAKSSPKAEPQPQAARVSPSRSAAFDLLESIGRTSAHSDDLLHGPRLAGLSQVDRDLTVALVLGVLRWQIGLDARIRPLLSRPDMLLSESVAIVLRLGAFQLLHMERIPAHAALNESVELARAVGHAHAAGMVNAILRKLVGAPPARKPLVESTAAMAERLGHPDWLVQRWTGHYGRAAAEAICSFDQQEPRASSLFNPAAEGRVLPVMDAGSRLVAELTAVAKPDASRVWDCCAAPGGKTLVLAERLKGAGLLATDRSPVRLKRMEQRIARDLPNNRIYLELADATALPESLGSFDLILCDVPCSGTGTLARNPEIRHRLLLAELRRQGERQSHILGEALKRLAPGGRLVYSTCSLEPEECEAVVQHALGEVQHPMELVDVAPLLHALREGGLLSAPDSSAGWTQGSFLRTIPGAGFSGDGFFAAILQRPQ